MGEQEGRRGGVCVCERRFISRRVHCNFQLMPLSVHSTHSRSVTVWLL